MSITDVDDDTACTAEFDASFALVQRREFVVPDHLMIHDWTFTDSHYVLLGNRIKLDIPGTEWRGLEYFSVFLLLRSEPFAAYLT